MKEEETAKQKHPHTPPNVCRVNYTTVAPACSAASVAEQVLPPAAPA